MNKENLLILQLSSEELIDLIQSTVSKSIQGELLTLLQRVKKESVEELYSRKQVADLYNISYVTLRTWEKHNIIPKPIRKGSRVYWTKSDIMNDIQTRGGNDAK